MSGDIDGDGKINAKDSNLLKQILAGTIHFEETTNEFLSSDIDKDGNISAKDSNCLKLILAGL